MYVNEKYKISINYQLTIIKILHSFKNPKKPLYSLVSSLKLYFTIFLVSSPSLLSPRLFSKEATARSFCPRGEKKKKGKKGKSRKTVWTNSKKPARIRLKLQGAGFHAQSNGVSTCEDALWKKFLIFSFLPALPTLSLPTSSRWTKKKKENGRNKDTND